MDSRRPCARDRRQSEQVHKNRALAGSALFLVLAPGTVAGLVPYWLTRWHAGGTAPGPWGVRACGAVLIAAGLASLLDSFLRFAREGLGTPAPVAPPGHLVVTGQYRHVRNPMYVAVLAIVLGQAVVLWRGVLLAYGCGLFALFHAFVVLYEERRLAATFGASYDAYCHHVWRWWPRLTPWRDEAP